MTNAIQVTNLTKKYGDLTAVDGISFEVREGELFAFLGENGAGKSTTINILCTILEKTDGEVRVFGHELSREDDEIRKLIGIVFQNSVLDRKLTVGENLMTRGAYYGLNKKQIKSRLEPYMESFEIGEIWNRKYEKLSGGQRRRVDIVRALINEPRILFLDEPTTGLDPKSRKVVWDHIRKLKKEKNLTIFLTTHYMEETADADEVKILDHGKIIASGTPAELKSRFASSKLIWYTEKNSESEEIISGYDWSYEADHYNVKFTGTITDLLSRNSNVITDYEVIKGTMDDVFLNLTGREMEL
ncbi:MAG: ABC transporter ATP-binding protein [Lachnospiraceae bacterium]|nr:ABC transporter ATP-binding protein [Lachnospiraceae bacterium]